MFFNCVNENLKMSEYVSFSEVIIQLERLSAAQYPTIILSNDWQ